jgi:hypothetical protein
MLVGVVVAGATAPVVAGLVFAVLTLVGELVITMANNSKLATENYALLVENKKLVAQRDALLAERTPPPAPAAAPKTAANGGGQRAPLLRMASRQAPPRPQPRANPPARTWPAAQPSVSASGEGDLLPGSAKRRVAPQRSGNDLLPRHR